MTSIADMWASFDDAVVPEDATARTRETMRVAFYSGAMGYLYCQRAIIEMDEAQSAAYLHGLNEELKAFNDFVIQRNRENSH